MHDALYGPTNYLARLRPRMEERGFPHDDPLYRQVSAAYEAIRQVRIDFLYLSCDGTGQRRRIDDE